MMVENIPNNLDPRLQKAMLKSQLTEKKLENAESKEELIPVIAKVTDVKSFHMLPGVHDMNDIALAPDQTGRIVTASVAVSELSNIHQSSVVLSLKGAQQLKPLLKDTRREINVPPIETVEGNGGAGVIVGIVDHECDFVYRSFRRDDDTTRLIALAIQEIDFNEPNINKRTKFRVYNSRDINQALLTPNPYRYLNYQIRNRSHGTHVMDIAAGNGRNNKSAGVAPNADLIFVEPAYWDIVKGNLGSFGDSKNLIDAVKFIFVQAGNQPCVVNISLGTNGGPHDGTSLVEQALDGLVMERHNRAIVIAAGNSYNDNIHATGIVQQNRYVDLHWKIPLGDTTLNEMEIWYQGEDKFRIEVLTQNNEVICSVGLGENYFNGQIFVTQTRNEDNGDNVVMIFNDVERGANLSGTWIIRLRGDSVRNGKFHAWIERDNHIEGVQSSLVTLNDNTHTLGSISCGHKSIVVGSYSAKSPNSIISFFSSAGPTRDGRQKPDISSPGGNVEAASSLTNDGIIGMSGTSMAAPAVTGVIALMLAEAKSHRLTLSIDQISNILKQTARSHPPTRQVWDNQYGYGRVDAKAALMAVRNLANETTAPMGSSLNLGE
ncbi:S8 family peptidase [Paenibacillus arenosi]|uniref:S8 family peptidase n=1 Tax=Paenibacillus arenosi TaxID=2774142 RepID=A0ABR9B2E2_9BACL|nr:S8 family peptidase [Paenibacillus arenosi]MBD8500089.1 S8 family peptidase [Paenibacillus arenosi]